MKEEVICGAKENVAVTMDYALEKLSAALKVGDMEEVHKWDMCIRGENDLRARHRARTREYRADTFAREIKRAYNPL